MAEYLKIEAIARGVVRTEGEVEYLNQDEKGFVSSVNLKDKTKHNCNFIF